MCLGCARTLLSPAVSSALGDLERVRCALSCPLLPRRFQINRRPSEYWSRVMEIARLNNLSRVQRCGQIMGRAEAGEMSAAQIFYPCMQVTHVPR